MDIFIETYQRFLNILRNFFHFKFPTKIYFLSPRYSESKNIVVICIYPSNAFTKAKINIFSWYMC